MLVCGVLMVIFFVVSSISWVTCHTIGIGCSDERGIKNAYTAMVTGHPIIPEYESKPQKDKPPQAAQQNIPILKTDTNTPAEQRNVLRQEQYSFNSFQKDEKQGANQQESVTSIPQKEDSISQPSQIVYSADSLMEAFENHTNLKGEIVT